MDIRFPRDKTSGTVVITGLYENVEDAKEHLMTLAEDYVSVTTGELILCPHQCLYKNLLGLVSMCVRLMLQASRCLCYSVL